MRFTSHLLITSLLFNLPIASWAVPTQVYEHGNPTAVEQYVLELINRARMNPSQEGIWLDTLDTDYAERAKQTKPEFFTNLREEFNNYAVAQPLAFNPLLLTAARLHSQDMLDRNFFSHTNPDGLTPFDRINNQGYRYNNAAENIGPGADNEAEAIRSHFEFMVDHNNLSHAFAPLGHRLNILGTQYSEVGVGNVGDLGNGYITHVFGNQGKTFLVGVVYEDKNANNFYDIGEGLPGVMVMPTQGDYYAVTSASGGYAILLEPFETVEVQQPIEVSGNTWTDAHAAADTAFRENYAANNAELLNLSVTASGGSLSAPITRQINMIKPVQVNYRLVQPDGLWWTTSPLIVGSSSKLDFIVTSDSANNVDEVVTTNPNEVLIPPDTAGDTSSLPELGGSITLSLTGQPDKIDTRFYGGLNTGDNLFNSQREMTRGANAPQLAGRLAIDPQHIGQVANVLLVVGVEPDAPYTGGLDTVYMTVNSQNSVSMVDLYASPTVWLPQLADAFMPNVTLTETVEINVNLADIQFSTDVTAVSYFFMGYALAEGTLVYGNPMILQVQ